MRISNNTPLTTTSQVTDLTKSLSHNELKLLGLRPKFIRAQKLDDKLLLDIEINFRRTTYQLKWLSKIQDESNTTTTTTTNTNISYLHFGSPYSPISCQQRSRL